MRELPGMQNRNMSMQPGENIDERYNFSKGFPTRENCDLNDPREMFLWALCSLPGVRGGQLVMPVDYNMVVSEHLWECGTRLTAPPIKKWQPPASGEPHWMTAPGRWVPLDTPDVEKHPARAALDMLTSTQRAELLKLLLDEQAQEPGDDRA